MDNKILQVSQNYSNFKSKAPSLDKNNVDQSIDEIEKYADTIDKEVKEMPSYNFSYQYTTNVNDTRAVINSSYNDMGRKSMPVKDFEKACMFDENQTAEAVDLNKDGNIDVAEYSATKIAADILSKNTTDPLKADGNINGDGMTALMAYTQKSNAAAAQKLYASIYNTYNLGANLNEIPE